MRKPLFKIITLFALCSITVRISADETEYASDEELLNEILSRQADIERTRERIESLAQNEILTLAEIHAAKRDVEHVQTLTIQRAKLFYRLYRNGGSIRYLLGSSSATQLLKRLRLLRLILMEGFEAGRSAGLRLAEAQSALEETQKKKSEAQKMLKMLEDAFQDLFREQQRRNTANLEIANLETR